MKYKKLQIRRQIVVVNRRIERCQNSLLRLRGWENEKAEDIRNLKQSIRYHEAELKSLRERLSSS